LHQTFSDRNLPQNTGYSQSGKSKKSLVDLYFALYLVQTAATDLFILYWELEIGNFYYLLIQQKQDLRKIDPPTP
jgi:hypothetical protein